MKILRNQLKLNKELSVELGGRKSVEAELQDQSQRFRKGIIFDTEETEDQKEARIGTKKGFREEQDILKQERDVIEKKLKASAVRLLNINKENELFAEMKKENETNARRTQESAKALLSAENSISKTFSDIIGGIRKQSKADELKQESQQRVGEGEEAFTERKRDINIRVRQAEAEAKILENFFEQAKKLRASPLSDEERIRKTDELRNVVAGQIEKANAEIIQAENNKAQRILNAIEEEKDASLKAKLGEIRNIEDISEKERTALLERAKALRAIDLPKEEFDKRLERIEAGPEKIIDSTQARGAFNARAVQALGRAGQTLQEKIFEENKKTAENTAKIAAKAGNIF